MEGKNIEDSKFWKKKYEDLKVDFDKSCDNFDKCHANFKLAEANFNQCEINFWNAISQRDENKKIIDSLKEEIRLLKLK